MFSQWCLTFPCRDGSTNYWKIRTHLQFLSSNWEKLQVEHLLKALMDFQLHIDLKLSLDSFRSTFMCLFHFSIKGPLSMVFAHFQRFFQSKGFNEWFHPTSLVGFPCGCKLYPKVFCLDLGVVGLWLWPNHV